MKPTETREEAAVRHHGTARAPERASGPERAWHGARWRARDLARMAQFQWEQMSQWEVTGALMLAAGVLCVALFQIPPMPVSAHEFCTGEFGLLCAAGAVIWAVARARRGWHGDGTPGRER
jgi:hypothetical protein